MHVFSWSKKASRQGMKHRNAKLLPEKVSKLTASDKMLFGMSARCMITRR